MPCSKLVISSILFLFSFAYSNAGLWSGIREASPCSVTCGPGFIRYTETCVGEGECKGSPYSFTPCWPALCRAGSWIAWSDCSVTCGHGRRTRTRNCTGDVQSKTCLIQDFYPKDRNFPTTQSQFCRDSICPNTWTSWQIWGSCSASCGSGTQIRKRYCQSKNDCIGTDTLARGCVDNPICGGWTRWSKWSTCTATCNSGSQTRRRHCTSDSCEGSLRVDFRRCFYGYCPNYWGGWTRWSSCSGACNESVGTRTRTRPCYSGNDCLGKAEETDKSCSILLYPGCNSGWKAWLSWSRCSVTCGSGVQTRNRDCWNVETCDVAEGFNETRSCTNDVKC